MANCDQPNLLPISDALARMAAQVSAVSDTEALPLVNALDRILAEDILATIAVPPQDNSAMDGYALRAGDSGSNSGTLQVIGEALAGHPFSGEVVSGTCVRIMTGAPVPAGADSVVMQENTRRQGDQLTVLQAPRPAENIRRRGEDIAEGNRVLLRGQRLGPVAIALLASLGMERVKVYRKLKVAVFSTGDELTIPGQPLTNGQIYDSNRYGIVALLQRMNVEIFDLGLIPDQPAAIKAAFSQASQQADAIISSGGVSVGDADFVKAILLEMGQIDFWKVAIKPGKPFAFGHINTSRFFGLPGNPVSALVTLHQLALPILRQMAGETVEPALYLPTLAGNSFKKRPGRSDYQRATLTADADGICRASSRGAQGSGVLTSFSGANCYAVLEAERGTVAEGEYIQVLPFDRFIS